VAFVDVTPITVLDGASSGKALEDCFGECRHLLLLFLVPILSVLVSGVLVVCIHFDRLAFVDLGLTLTLALSIDIGITDLVDMHL